MAINGREEKRKGGGEIGHNHGTEADDFLFGYQFKAPTPNIQHLLKKGTKAETRLIPIFLTPHLPQPLLHRQRALPSPPCIVNNVFFDPLTGEKFTMKSHSFEKWNAPEENYREGHRGRLKFFSEKENQETQQPHPREGNAPEKNPHCVAVVLPGKDARCRQFLLLLWCCQSRSPLRPRDTEWRRP
ncbi:hypothetical protein JHK84_040687 [Glycine max]|nr:hypothetical protein JHK86_040471 [Glycine max]KAG4966088.1 hypothetical protein JHK85_041063 [Glycine max]KAG5122347.1 hypothetical protein JHK84_040687 [Glycine max]